MRYEKDFFESLSAAAASRWTLRHRNFMDGRGANSYANVAWVFGQHDRGWKERETFGEVHYMSAGGLERKAKPSRYLEKVERLIAESRTEEPTPGVFG